MKAPFEQGDGGVASGAVASGASASLPIGLAVRGRLADYSELAKVRLSLLVLVVAAVGFCLADSAPVNLSLLAHAIVGTALAAFGANALNQYMERDFDRRMRRTAQRPLPAGRMAPREALLFGTTAASTGVLYLALVVNNLAASLALATVLLYLLTYTPLKRKTVWNTAVGAIPGALPPMIGFAAAAGTLQPMAWMLFAILFAWQLPHFFAIAWMYREDYRAGGYRMLSVADQTGRATGRQTVLFSVVLLVVSLSPWIAGFSGPVYLLGAIALGALMIFAAARFARLRTTAAARVVLWASLVYLPLLMMLLLLDRWPV
ncbi:MAG TPA: heme o synthase [Phycisphaerae bacterium]|nr:heme o synthase [Phycisphaerae bacterium]